MAAAAVGKGLVCAVTAGAAAYVSLLQANASWTVAPVALASVGGFLFYARYWIQGYWFDRRCWISKDLTGRIAVVTGGTVGGLGFAGAKILSDLGATVVLTVRSDAKGDEATALLGPRSSYVVVDFCSLKSVREGARVVMERHDRIDMLVLNAGIGKGDAAKVWMTNQVGPFLFTECLTPLIERTAKAHGDVRVVAVSSGAHKRASIAWETPYDPSASGVLGGASYGQSKLAQIMHLKEVEKRLRSRPGCEGEYAVRCISITPGFAYTNIVDVPPAAKPLLWLLARSAHVGAQVIKMACVSEVPGSTYLSNCYIKPTEGAGGISNQPEAWGRLWSLCEACVAEARFP